MHGIIYNGAAETARADARQHCVARLSPLCPYHEKPATAPRPGACQDQIPRLPGRPQDKGDARAAVAHSGMNQASLSPSRFHSNPYTHRPEGPQNHQAPRDAASEQRSWAPQR